jgi:hypothetical protein
LASRHTSLDRFGYYSPVVTLDHAFNPAKTDKFVWQNVDAIDAPSEAPKARNMKARGKREARRPWILSQKAWSPEKGEIPRRVFRPFRPSPRFFS